MDSLAVIVPDFKDQRIANATDAERGVWIQLIAYCSHAENGGVIRDCRGWTPKGWTVAVGTDAAPGEDAELWTWTGDDLTVNLYRTEHEDRVKMRREAGRIGGKASAKTRRHKKKKRHPKKHGGGGGGEATVEATVEQPLTDGAPIAVHSSAVQSTALHCKAGAAPNAAGSGEDASQPDPNCAGRWPIPDAAKDSDLERIIGVWIDDTGGDQHIIDWHQECHPNKPLPTLPEDYPLPPDEDAGGDAV